MVRVLIIDDEAVWRRIVKDELGGVFDELEIVERSLPCLNDGEVFDLVICDEKFDRSDRSGLEFLIDCHKKGLSARLILYSNQFSSNRNRHCSRDIEFVSKDNFLGPFLIEN